MFIDCMYHIHGIPFVSQILQSTLQMHSIAQGSKMPVPCRFEWSQKVPSLVHSSIMTCVGLIIVLRRDWQSPTIMTDKDELVRHPYMDVLQGGQDQLNMAGCAYSAEWPACTVMTCSCLDQRSGSES